MNFSVTNNRLKLSNGYDVSGSINTSSLLVGSSIGINPTSTLDVSGNSNFTGNITVDTNVFVVDASNNRVGIGTNAPAYPLDVSGSANISGNLVVNGSPVSGPSYTYSREHYFLGQTAGGAPYNSLLPLTFFQRVDGSGTNFGPVTFGVETTSVITLLSQPTPTNGGIAFLCPTTLSKITGSINFGFKDDNNNDISLNIYKTSITNAYTNFATGATLLSSSRFIYNTRPNVANITVPVNVTNAGLTNNDIVYVGFQILPGSTGSGSCRFAMRYTLSFS